MTDVSTRAGGPPVPSTTLVQADQITITGDGSHERPLAAAGGAFSVVVDDVTILGAGTLADPLRAGPSGGTFASSLIPGR